MVTYTIIMYFDYQWKESVSKLIFSCFVTSAIVNHCAWVFCWLLFVDYWTNFICLFSFFIHHKEKKYSDAFSMCMSICLVMSLSTVYRTCLNHRLSKNLVAIFCLCFYVLFVLLIPTLIFHTHMKSQKSSALYPDGVCTLISLTKSVHSFPETLTVNEISSV